MRGDGPLNQWEVHTYLGSLGNREIRFAVWEYTHGIPRAQWGQEVVSSPSLRRDTTKH